MSAEQWCGRCGYHMGALVAGCPNCGTARADGTGGGNVLPLVAWAFVPLLIPIYPIAGVFGTIALVVPVLIGDAIGSRALAFVVAAAAVYVTVYFTFKYEQRAAHRRGYRIVRDLLRLALGAGVIFVAVNNAGSGISEANALFVIVLGVPLCFWVLKLLDKVLRAAGPRKATKQEIAAGAPTVVSADTPPPRALTFWNTLNYPTALFVGFGVGIVGALAGGFNLFAGALAWLAGTGAVLGVQILVRLLGAAGRASSDGNTKLGGVPGAILWGGIGGAIAGAVLGRYIDGRVQIEAMIIMAVVGIILSVVVNRVRRGRAAAG